MRNKFVGVCYRCGGTVGKGQGHFERHAGGWRTQHADCAIKFRKSHKKGENKMNQVQNKKTEAIKLTTKKFRVSFANVFKPRPGFDGGEPEFSVEMLFDKKEDITWLKKEVKAAAVAMFGANLPQGLRNPIKDGDTKNLDGYPGHWFVTAKSKSRPGIVDKKLNEIIDPADFYSGCYAIATVTIKAYNTKGNKGVSVYLQNLQKTDDGPAFSGKKNAKDDFAPIEDLNGDLDSNGGDQAANDLDF